ncbi:MAG: hypothetical protein ABR592_07665 [Nitriliruptorales bacterium]
MMELFVAALLVAVPLVDGASAVRRAKDRRRQRDANRAALGLSPRRTASPVKSTGSLIDPSDPHMPAWLRWRLQEREGRR